MCHKNIVSRCSFTSVTKDFRSLIHTWLAEAHAREWFYGEGLKKTLEDLDVFFLFEASAGKNRIESSL